MQRFILWACLTTVRIFFARIRVSGGHHVPEGPVLVVANHPNGLMDPCVIRLGLKREFGFLAKSTLFGNPVGKTTMEAFAAIPVFRAQDGNDTAANNKTFELCTQRFVQGRSVVIFPEGVSHSDARLRRLKTGAARIALQTLDEHPDVSLQILPVGLFYEAKETFRSGVAVSVGEPIDVRRYLASWRSDGFEAANQLTQDIDEALGGLVLQAESADIWNGLVAVARWTDPDASDDVGRAQARARELSAAYGRMLHEAPEDAQNIVERVQAFAHDLRVAGIDDPWATDAQLSFANVSRSTLSFVVWAPFALIGFLASWLPYRAFGPIAERVAHRERDLVSTIKGVLGMVFLPPIWAAEAAALGWFVAPWLGFVGLVALPLCGFVALRYGERFDARRKVLRAFWLRVTHKGLTDELRARRAELGAAVDAALKIYRVKD